MRIAGLLVVGALLLLGAFAALNWDAFTAPTTLSLLVTSVMAPLGIIMLTVAIVLAALGLVFAALVRTTMLLESRRLTRELQTQRDLSERAEASRFTELRSFLERQLTDLDASVRSAPQSVIERINALDRSLQEAIASAATSVASSIGQAEGKLEREIAASASRH
jgi:uncharacterized integral membrane protein